MAFAPFHWGRCYASPAAGQANSVTPRDVDPVSLEAELKATPVSVESAPNRRDPAPLRRSPARVRRLVVIGTGMAGLETV